MFLLSSSRNNRSTDATMRESVNVSSYIKKGGGGGGGGLSVNVSPSYIKKDGREGGAESAGWSF